jgi:glycerophosphoryl diester phosphodiesterase
LADLEPWPYPLWIAHRGAGKLAPENTLAAFRLGAGYGYRAFECDVKLSADGVPFLLHDATLERTTDGTGVAGTLAWSELSQLDAGGWLARQWAGEPLPTLRALAAFVRRNAMWVDVELKPTPGTELATGSAVALACRELWQGAAPHERPFFSSFRPEALQGARDAAPEFRRALLLDTLWQGWFEVAQALGCEAVITHHPLMDEALVQALHGAGLRALCYTVNDAVQARRLLAIGIDGLITDAVDRFAPGSAAVAD